MYWIGEAGNDPALSSEFADAGVGREAAERFEPAGKDLCIHDANEMRSHLVLPAAVV